LSSQKKSDASGKEKTLHTLLEQYTERINPRREFFRVSQEEVRKFFDLMDGEMLGETRVEEEEEGGRKRKGKRIPLQSQHHESK